MNGFLLDTDVVSMMSPTSSLASTDFLTWLEYVDSQRRVYLAAVTIHEIEKGIALLDHKGATAKAAVLRSWLVGLVAIYDDTILSVDAQTASIAGRLEAQAIASGHNPGMADAMIAGIATARNLVVVTRNRRHFLPFRIEAMSPDEAVSKK